MAFNYQNLIGEGTDAELLVLARAAYAQILVTGQAYGTNNRSLTRADLADLQRTITWLEGRIDAAAGSSSAPKETFVRLRRPC